MHRFEGSKIKKSIILIGIALKYKTATEFFGLSQFRNFISTNCAIQKQKRLTEKFKFVYVVMQHGGNVIFTYITTHVYYSQWYF